MSFYVTLPSNSSKENTLSKFTTKLDPPIILESDECEVGLAEIMFPYNFKKKPVKFSNWGRVIATLHFRPKRSI